MARRLPRWSRGALRTERESKGSEAVLNRRFLVVLFIALLGFGFEQILRPVIPLVVIDRGGGAVLVGLVAAVYSLPSVFFRPLIGRLVDSWHHGRLLQLGALISAITPAGLLLPGIPSLVPVRFLQGTGWAFYSVSAHALMAKIAPAHRRGEASGYFQAMPALAMLVGPGLGIWLYATMGLAAPILVASALGFIAVVISLKVRIPVQPGAPHIASTAPSQPSGSYVTQILEPSALPATLMITTFMSAHALFTVFAPVYAVSVGAPVETLVLYYPAYGAVLTLSQFAAGSISDRVGRGLTIRLGCGMAICGLIAAALGDGMGTLTLGASAYAIGVSLVSPTTSALAIDRAPNGRLGSAMATYSLGYQLATGVSSLLWGTMISASGFFLAFAGAIALQILTVGASLRFASNLAHEARGTFGGSPCA